MKNILLFEAFTSNKIKSLLKYLNKEESKRIIDDLKSIMVEYDYPISTINDIHVSYNKTYKALDITPESGFYIKYFYDKNGTFIAKTTTRPEKVNIEKIKELDKPFEMDFNQDGYLNLFSCSKNSNIDDYLKWFKTGDKVFAVLEDIDEVIDGDADYEVILSTIYVTTDNEMYLIQDEREGTYCDEDFSRFGRYSWVICRESNGRVCGDHLIVAFEDKNLNNKNLQFDKKQTYEYNFNSNKANSDYFKILDDADFAVTIKVGDILNTEFKKLSDIKRHREERKS